MATTGRATARNAGVRARGRRAGGTLVLATALLFLFELLWLWARGETVAFDYASLYLAWSILIALLFGGVALLGGIGMALVAWTALNVGPVLVGE